MFNDVLFSDNEILRFRCTVCAIKRSGSSFVCVCVCVMQLCVSMHAHLAVVGSVMLQWYYWDLAILFTHLLIQLCVSGAESLLLTVWVTFLFTDAAFKILNPKAVSRFFRLNSNNALIQFLLEVIWSFTALINKWSFKWVVMPGK